MMIQPVLLYSSVKCIMFSTKCNSYTVKLSVLSRRPEFGGRITKDGWQYVTDCFNSECVAEDQKQTGH